MQTKFTFSISGLQKILCEIIYLWLKCLYFLFAHLFCCRIWKIGDYVTVQPSFVANFRYLTVQPSFVAKFRYLTVQSQFVSKFRSVQPSYVAKFYYLIVQQSFVANFAISHCNHHYCG